MVDVLVVTGPPGAGKSTVAGLLVDRFEPAALVAGDVFFAFLRRGAIPPWREEAHHQNEVVTTAAGACTGSLAAGGLTVVYDGVLGPWFLPGFLAASGLSELDYAVLLPSLEQCLERVSTRRDHGFTDLDATRRMHASFADADLPSRHLVRDAGGPEETAAIVLERMAEGALRHPR